MKSSAKKTLGIYLSHIGKYKFASFAIVFSIVVSSFIISIIPVYFRNFFDVLAGGDAKEAVVSRLINILIFITILEFVRWFFWRIAFFIAVYTQTKIMADIANTCFKYLHKHSFSYFNNNFSGSLVKRVNYFVNAFERISDSFIWNILKMIVTTLVIVVVLFWKNYILGLGILVWLTLFIIINLIFSKYKFKYDIKVNEAISKASGFLSDTITNNSNIKLFNGYKKEVLSFFDLHKNLRKLKIFSWNLENIFEAVQTFLIIVLQTGLFYIAIILWKKDVFSFGDFFLLQSYVIMIIMNGWQFSYMIRHIYRDLSDAEEMTVILNTPHDICDIKNAKKLQVKKGLIEFKDVNFYYHKTRKILDNFSLTINPKERVALIGPSGAGKSTIAKIILRNYDISSGEILIDNQNIGKVTQESLWRNVSLVPQDPILFHRTLRENISYGKFDATDEEIIKVAKMAHCHEFIKNFPDGYDTYVGERGVKLSGGERQRVAIARAIIKNSPILILDEATSSLDSHSEKLIQDALEKLMKDKTVIVIAHRLSTIRKMNRIIYIDEGKIKEVGTHEELEKNKNGHYSKLWNLQVGGFIE